MKVNLPNLVSLNADRDSTCRTISDGVAKGVE